jgi:Serpin (serine protease inhibitor)
VSTAGYVARSVPRDTPVEVMADLPFQFFIFDGATETVLFEGRVVDPKPKSTRAELTGKHTDTDFWLANFQVDAIRVFVDSSVTATMGDSPVNAPTSVPAIPVSLGTTTAPVLPVTATPLPPVIVIPVPPIAEAPIPLVTVPTLPVTVPSPALPPVIVIPVPPIAEAPIPPVTVPTLPVTVPSPAQVLYSPAMQVNTLLTPASPTAESPASASKIVNLALSALLVALSTCSWCSLLRHSQQISLIPVINVLVPQ